MILYSSSLVSSFRVFVLYFIMITVSKGRTLLIVVYCFHLLVQSECVNISTIDDIYDSIKGLPEYENLSKSLNILCIMSFEKKTRVILAKTKKKGISIIKNK